jgi:hypothetical protein
MSGWTINHSTDMQTTFCFLNYVGLLPCFQQHQAEKEGVKLEYPTIPHKGLPRKELKALCSYQLFMGHIFTACTTRYPKLPDHYSTFLLASPIANILFSVHELLDDPEFIDAWN